MNHDMPKYKKLKVRVPATTANVGPGFDSLGIAFNMYTTISFEQEGEAKENNPKNIKLEFSRCEEAFANKDNLVYTSYLEAMKKTGGKFPSRLRIEINSDIPVCRGLGSSAACIVAGVTGAFELSGKTYEQDEILEICNQIEGHPDNVAPALMGGFKAAIQEAGSVYATNIPVDPQLRFFALVPNFKLSTEYSRSVIPLQVDFKDAIYNVSHVALMIGAFINRDYKMLKTAVNDRLHQEYRVPLVEEYDEVMRICEDIGSTATFLSGAGPTIMVIDQNEVNSRQDYEQKLSGLNKDWKVHELNIDFEGAKISWC
ncbi:MAG: homoserine kinase [Proteocatella sp.]